MMFKSLGTQFQQTTFGTWGDFVVQNSRVSYLQAKARIGTAAKDNEKRLASLLRPVREVLPTSKMDFNQLLQRDLDDHRVASTLVRYILAPDSSRPVFFPPIVAALLPFEGTNVAERFPSRATIDKLEDGMGAWSGYSFGSAFKFEKLVDKASGQEFEVKIGRLSWNPEEAQLVVIDGQHRAMALLAIDRTINDSWRGDGEKYKYFYEAAIKEALKGVKPQDQREIVNSLEFPVTLIWFPDSNEQQPFHHEVARKLFVDINKNARAPSESRILLLSDNDLLSILTRTLLNEFRTDGSGLPIYAIEYDHPGRDQASSSKWSAISNVMILRDCVNRAVFGPEKYIEDMAKSFGGRESLTHRGTFMRDTLAVHDEIPEVIEDMKRSEINEERFPRSKVDFLQERFLETWGRLIFKLLSEIAPYAAHGLALTELRDSWTTGGSTDTLARDAIFEGVGMYWTIRDAHAHWESENRLRRESQQQAKPKTDIVKTWEALLGKSFEFKKRRANTYLGKDSDQAVRESEGAYQIFATNACQLGLVLALRSIAHKAELDLRKSNVFASEMIAAINAALTSGGKAPYNRRLVFSREIKSPINHITKLDSPLSIYFRYFWLELLTTSDARAKISIPSVLEVLDELRDRGRIAYVKLLEDHFAQAIRQQDPTKDLTDIQKQAKAQAHKALSGALSTWFAVSPEQWDAWNTASTSPSAVASQVKSDADVEEEQVVDITNEPWENVSST